MENDLLTKNPTNEGERLSGRSMPFDEFEKSGSSGDLLGSIVSLFERVAAANPDNVACVCGNVSLTYGNLNAQANYVARRLRDLGVRTDSFVAIYLERSPEMLIAILGILKAGGAYLPIDSMYPATRVLEVLEDAKPVAILTTRSLLLQVFRIRSSQLSVSDFRD